MNHWTGIGRLTRDPDIRYTGNGDSAMCVARFTLAVDRGRTSANGEKEADFISCVAFGKTAEFYERYVHQGMKMAVEGRIQTGSYTNKENQKVYTTDVVIERTEFAESKRDDGQAAQRPQTQQPYGQNPASAPYQQNGQNQRQAYGAGGGQPTNRPYQQGSGAYGELQNQQSEVGQGFLNIPDGVEDEGLPFN